VGHNNGREKCQICEKMKLRLHRHHITPRRFVENNASIIESRICSQCHADVHHYYTKRAMEICLKNNPDFFINLYDEFITQRK
jgi:hypothetical protein